jgi:hypothetical protein
MLVPDSGGTPQFLRLLPEVQAVLVGPDDLLRLVVTFDNHASGNGHQSEGIVASRFARSRANVSLSQSEPSKTATAGAYAMTEDANGDQSCPGDRIGRHGPRQHHDVDRGEGQLVISLAAGLSRAAPPMDQPKVVNARMHQCWRMYPEGARLSSVTSGVN